MLLTASFDLVVWPLVLLLVIRAVRRAGSGWWLCAGLVIGLSTWNKWLVVMLVLAVVGGLLVPVDNEEEGEPVAVCTGPTANWDRLWVELRHLD